MSNDVRKKRFVSGQTHQVSPAYTGHLHEHSDLIVLHSEDNVNIQSSLRKKEGREGPTSTAHTHLKKHQVLWALRNTVLHRGTFANAPLRRKARPPRQVRRVHYAQPHCQVCLVFSNPESGRPVCTGGVRGEEMRKQD